MKILVITKGPFPYGGAAVNRMIDYLHGLHKQGSEVCVHCIKPTEGKKDVRNKPSDVFKNIHYEYTSGTSVKPKHSLARIWCNIKGLTNSIKELHKSHKETKIDFLFLGVNNLTFSFIYYVICKRKGIKLIHERSEFPFITNNNSLLFKINLFLYLQITCKLFDGFIVITDNLANYFKKYISTKTVLYKLPILVEPERFAITSYTEEKYGKYFAYCGSMSGNKDGLPILIDSFYRVSSKHDDVKLLLIGSTQFNGFSKLKEKVQDLGLNDRIIFTGLKSRDELPELLSGSIGLCLSRPSSKQAEGGFPTKLGEYLATGKPVVVTKVGEIPDYLIDMENAYLCNPDSSEEFANKLDMLLTDRVKAKEIGINGQKLAFDDFNYEVQTQKLYDFLKGL